MHYCNHLSIMAAACSVAHSNVACVETETFSLGYVEPLIQREEEEELTEAIEKPKGKGRKRVRACTKKKLGLRKNALTQVLTRS